MIIYHSLVGLFIVYNVLVFGMCMCVCVFLFLKKKTLVLIYIKKNFFYVTFIILKDRDQPFPFLFFFYCNNCNNIRSVHYLFSSSSYSKSYSYSVHLFICSSTVTYLSSIIHLLQLPIVSASAPDKNNNLYSIFYSFISSVQFTFVSGLLISKVWKSNT